MFDIGFLEVLLIFVLGLVIIGPDKLPGTIKTCAIWVSRFKRSIREAREEFEQQIGADEIRREIHNEQVMDSMRKWDEQRQALQEKVEDFKKDVEEAASADESPKASQQHITDEHSHADEHDCQHCSSSEEKDTKPDHPPMIEDDWGALPGEELPGEAPPAETTPEKPPEKTQEQAEDKDGK